MALMHACMHAGYLTPPGGVHPYWEDCYYSMFQVHAVHQPP